jgi:response regulator RpfG family c-di-GMP phosphodiesterase
MELDTQRTSRPNEAAAAAVDDPRIGQHCTVMPTDSQRGSSARRETEEKALDLGAHDYLRKPVQTRSLVARVRAVLKHVNT